jgi:hypothetical protein
MITIELPLSVFAMMALLFLSLDLIEFKMHCLHVVVLRPRKSGLDPRNVRVCCVVDGLPLGHYFLST